jgi:hypothetical protein
MDIFNWIIGVGLSIIVLSLAWMMFVSVALRVIKAKAAQESESDKDQANTMIPLQVETTGTQFLCYHAKTMDFVCQGSSLEEIRSSFKLRYPDRSAAVVAGDQKAVSTLQQQLKELHETGHCI